MNRSSIGSLEGSPSTVELPGERLSLAVPRKDTNNKDKYDEILQDTDAAVVPLRR